MAGPLFSYTFLDGHGIQATGNMFVTVPGATTLSGLHDAWIAMGGILDAITDAKIVRGGVNIKFTNEVAWKSAPVAASDVSMAGLFEFIQASSIYRQSYVVPAIAEAALTSGKIDITDVAVKAYINGLVSGFGAGTAFLGESKYGNDLTGFLGCHIPTRSHRKSELKNTYVSGANYVP